MEPTTAFSGILSGLDFRALVDAIIDAESRPIRTLEDEIGKIEARSTALVSFEGFLSSLRDSSKSLSDSTMFGARTVTGESSLVSATAANGAELGSHQVRVLQVATAERLSGGSFASATDELGLSGEFLLGGQRVAISTTDSLQDVAAAINQANTGSNASGVQASVLSITATEHRLILTAENTGSDGIQLVDGADGLLRSLGVLDANTSVREYTTDGALSDRFANSSQTIGTLLGLASAPPASTVDIGGVSVTIDLSTMSLDDIANEINTQAPGNSGVSAQVVADSSGSSPTYRLDISGTTAFTDSNRTLEILGVLEGGQSDVAEELQSANALTVKNTANAANTTTKLRDLGINGSDARVSNGDTLDISGTRGDGSTFSFTFTVGANDDVGTLLARINDATDGLQAGSRTATASLDANGNLVVIDDAGGESQLSLNIRSNNEGGGTLDFGAFAVRQDGYRRVIASGQDAQLEVDGVYMERASNSVGDVVSGLTLDLQHADPQAITTITVERDNAAAVGAVTGFVEAYNAAAEFISEQIAAPEEGEERGPLSGDTTLRGMQNRLREAMRETLAPGIAGSLTRLLDIGIELQQDGTFELDSAKLESALDADPSAVERLFGLSGTGSISELEFVGATDETVVGNYTVDITQAATRALLTGSGFSGTYNDNGTDTITLRDIQSGAIYSVDLNDGDTLSTIVANLNAELQTALQEIHVAGNALYSDPAGSTPATASTLLQDLRDGAGQSFGILAGDTFTISGNTKGGASFTSYMTVTDPATQTVGDLMQAIQTQLGSDTAVTIDANGVITATDTQAGGSLLTLSVVSDNLGGGSFDLGGITAQQEGRGASELVARDNGGQLEIAAGSYGSAHGFEISYAWTQQNSTGSLGLAAGTYTGLDVVGTIGGNAATGVGQLLTGDAGSDIEGLGVKYTGAATGAVGTFSFSRGIGALLELTTQDIIDGDFASISQIKTRSDERVQALENRVDWWEDRLDRREAMLLNRFISAEQAIAQASVQFDYLFSTLPTPGGQR